MKTGRPLRYETSEDLEKAIDNYFVENPEYPTVTGLALELGFTSRQSLYDYKEREEFSYTIKKAVLKIESLHEANLFKGASSGSIFWLKNRQWTDKQDFNVSGDLQPIRFIIEDEGKQKDNRKSNDG